jgi:hypothetical protein
MVSWFDGLIGLPLRDATKAARESALIISACTCTMDAGSEWAAAGPPVWLAPTTADSALPEQHQTIGGGGSSLFDKHFSPAPISISTLSLHCY